MRNGKLEELLAQFLPSELASDLAANYLEMCKDLLAGSVGQTTPGKFVEGFVQTLQFLESGTYEHSPKVDAYLVSLQSRASPVGDGLRICGCRIARAMYSLRSKRGIAHKSSIDPNSYDLAFLVRASSWILSELLRNAAGVDMDQAGAVVDQLSLPPLRLVESFEDHRLVLAQLPIGKEILVLLNSYFPNRVKKPEILKSLSRCNPATVKRRLLELRKEKLIDGTSESGFRLTSLGLRKSSEIIGSSLPDNVLSLAKAS